MTPHCLTTRFTYLPLMLLALFALALQGCGDGVRILPPSDADPTGYYINDGTASVDNGAGGTIGIIDLQALVDGKRIMMLSVAHELLYDGNITNISGNDFTADFTIYTGGELPVTATANGTIIAGSSITGTLTGSGVGSGSFTLLYATTNGDMANLSRIENVVDINPTWGAKIGGSSFEQEFFIDNVGVLSEGDFSGGGVFQNCELDGTFTPLSGHNLYTVSVTLMGCGFGGIANGSYTGLATSRTDTITDDTLVFSATNGLYSLDGDFK